MRGNIIRTCTFSKERPRCYRHQLDPTSTFQKSHTHLRECMTRCLRLREQMTSHSMYSWCSLSASSAWQYIRPHWRAYNIAWQWSHAYPIGSILVLIKSTYCLIDTVKECDRESTSSAFLWCFSSWLRSRSNTKRLESTLTHFQAWLKCVAYSRASSPIPTSSKAQIFVKVERLSRGWYCWVQLPSQQKSN